MSITIHRDVEQGTDEWLELRRGKLTASEMKLIITPTLKTASNDKERQHLFELAAQRITGYVEPHYISDDMLRGHEDEIRARDLYNETHAPAEQVGFIINTSYGFDIGYSPDGLVGDDGQIEIKSRRAKHHLAVLLNQQPNPDDIIQIQTGLMVSGRGWCDYISYCGGMPMVVLRVYPDATIQSAIADVATAFETRLRERLRLYCSMITSPSYRLFPTERVVEGEMII